ncbi:MAG TPA: COX15/CtaA family protein [Chloroflexota bacterium]|nr:COX15/CtaA family protein [Chloroflexota bacterium]
MRGYRALASAAAAATYLLIVAGAIVRVTGSGLGCPDWPTCHGQWMPPPDPAAVIEYLHRLLVTLSAPLILAVTLGAWLARREARHVLVPATVTPVLLGVQIALGAVVVRLELEAMAVLVHLAFALLVLGLLVWTAVAAGPAPQPSASAGPPPRRLQVLAYCTVAAVFGLILVGAYVRATGAGWACVGFPDCNGQALPFGSHPLVDLHLTHRLLAYAVAGLVGLVVWQAWRQGRARPPVVGAAATLAGLVAVQIAIGAVGVTTGLPAAVRALHVAGAAAVWANAVALAAWVTFGPWPPVRERGETAVPAGSRRRIYNPRSA